jgi:hypothetical protein
MRLYNIGYQGYQGGTMVTGCGSSTIEAYFWEIVMLATGFLLFSIL